MMIKSSQALTHGSYIYTLFHGFIVFSIAKHEIIYQAMQYDCSIPKGQESFVKVFVTGSTGFIGKHLVRRLAADGHAVRCLARRTSRVQDLQDLGVEIYYGDVSDPEVLLEGMAGCDCLFHLANLYSMWETDPDVFMRVNLEGTRTVLECAYKAGMGRVVYVSTVAVYGKPAQVPFDEDCEPGPVLFSDYARSKAAADRAAWDFHARMGLPLVVLYPGIVLGAGDDKASGQYIQGLIRRRLPSTIFHQSKATYVYVGDVVEAMLRAAYLPQAVGQKYLLGRTVLSGREFAELIRSISGVALPLFRFPDWMVTAASYLFTAVSALVRRPPLWGLSIDAAATLRSGFVIDGSKAARSLGIEYSPIDAALREAIESYRRQNEPAGSPALILPDRSTGPCAPLGILDKEMENQDG